jgi:succinate dehydrogenase / fumarate reductase flavoprotein subunit
LKARGQGRRHGHREYNPGWHTALDLKHLLTVSEAITLCGDRRKESRGGHFRDDFPDKDPKRRSTIGDFQEGADGKMKLRREPIPRHAGELKQVIEEMK